MSSLASVPRRGSVLAFAPFHDLLAAGTMRVQEEETTGRGERREPSEICIIGGAGDSGLELGYEYDYRFVQVTTIPSAPVCRLAWSKPIWTFTKGLLAAGLINGHVAVWNPLVRDDPDDEGYFDQDFPVEIHHDYFSAEGKPQEARLRAHARSGNLAKDFAGEVMANSGSTRVALFAKHIGPVRGLSFGSRSNSLLASGGSQGRILVFDLNDHSKDEVATLEFTEDDGVDISCLSWSRSDLIASASSGGMSIWNITAKSPLVRQFPWTKNSSAVEWSPRNENYLISAGYYCGSASLQLWDMRKLAGPVKELFKDAKGVLAIGWCPSDEDLLLACTGNNKISMLNINKGEVVNEVAGPGACFDICWSRKSKDHFAASYPACIRLYHRSPDILRI